ncbi:hypothetical protein ACQY1Q_10100 [Tenacibaculum sp. TC6]|uniref:hypothetical protein n=1 Tax=Tenacibaculum sp. TC6 TaxID=3423223 RepID=UPI003D35E60F
MNLPNIYKYIDTKYNPLIRYLFVLPSTEFLEFLEAVSLRRSIGKENHGYEIEQDFIEFWDVSNEIENTVNVTFQEFVEIIEPLKQNFIQEFPINEKEIDEVILKILNKKPIPEKEFSGLEKQFLNELEWFYRNYGNEWSLDDFSNKIKNNKKKLEKTLMYLSDMGYININHENKYSFEILRLPNNIN